MSQDNKQRPSLLQRQLLIDRNIQIPLLFYIFASTFIGIMAFSATTLGVMMFHYSYIETLGGQVILLASIFLSLSIFMYVGLFVTNKVAGPIHRLRRHLRDIADGKEPAMMVGREGDFIDDLVSDYNRMAETLQNRMSK